jgi:hypothetical protein
MAKMVDEYVSNRQYDGNKESQKELLAVFLIVFDLSFPMRSSGRRPALIGGQCRISGIAQNKW